MDKIITRYSSWNLKVIVMRGIRLFYLPNTVKMHDISNKDVLGGAEMYFLLQHRHMGQVYKRLLSLLFSHNSMATSIVFLISFNSKST